MTASFTPVPYRVVDRREETTDTTTLTLEPTTEAIATPQPGQFTMLWAFGIGEAPISLAGLDGDRLVHTVRAVGPVSQALAGATIGTTVGVRGPFGQGWPERTHPGGDVLVVAGGLGLAPVRPLVEALISGPDPGRRTVVIGARRPSELLYRSEIDRWRQHPDLSVLVTVDVAEQSWRGHVGLVTQLLDKVAIGPRTTAYVCGPEVMMTFTARRLLDVGVAGTDINLSLERNMHCATGQCGHCQLGPLFVCLDGPVRTWTSVEPLLAVAGR